MKTENAIEPAQVLLMDFLSIISTTRSLSVGKTVVSANPFDVFVRRSDLLRQNDFNSYGSSLLSVLGLEAD